MSKNLLIFCSFFLMSQKNIAQKGTNTIQGLVEVALPEDARKTGFGIYMKGGYGVGKHAQATLMTGISKFTYVRGGNARAIPFLLGYKQHIKRFFIEPQVGYGEIGGRYDIGSDYARYSKGALFFGIGAGYVIDHLHLSLRVQSAKESEPRRFTGGYNFVTVGIGAAYDLYHNK